MRNGATEIDRYQAPAERIRAARAGVSEVMRLLRTPTVEDAELCVDLLSAVVTQLQSAASMLRELDGTSNSSLRLSVAQLQRDVKTLAFALLESDRLVSGWARRLGAKTGGYTELGASAPLLLVKKVNVTA